MTPTGSPSPSNSRDRTARAPPRPATGNNADLTQQAESDLTSRPWTDEQLQVLREAAALLGLPSVHHLPRVLPRALYLLYDGSSRNVSVPDPESSIPFSSFHEETVPLVPTASGSLLIANSEATPVGSMALEHGAEEFPVFYQPDLFLSNADEGFGDFGASYFPSFESVVGPPPMSDPFALTPSYTFVPPPLELLASGAWHMGDSLDFLGLGLPTSSPSQCDTGLSFNTIPTPSSSENSSLRPDLDVVGATQPAVLDQNVFQPTIPGHLEAPRGYNEQQENMGDSNGDTDSPTSSPPTAGRYARAPQVSRDRPGMSAHVISKKIVTKKPGRRGPFQDPSEREQTGVTRRIGACIRCRVQKIRCLPDPANPHNPNALCFTCKSVQETAIIRPICVRKKVTEARLFDKGSHPQFLWTRRWKSMEIVNITNWATSDVKTIHVTQDVAGLTYPFRVREFIPEEGDSLQRTWKTGGVQMCYPCKNYAIEDMKQTGREMVSFVDGSIASFIDHYIEKSDWLLYQTYLMALKYSNDTEVDAQERELVRAALRLWVAVRMESKSERIVGEETLGHSPQDYDSECRNYGQVLLPPVMSAQIELMATAMVLEPSRKAVLVPLRKLMEGNKTKSWFTVYLCLFILLHSCALLTDFENKQARKYGSQSRYVYEKFVQELHYGSTILLSYFHYCNKGSHPLLMDWEWSPDALLADLSAGQIQFLKETSKHMKQKAAHFKSIRESDAFEDPYYFLAQLYNPDWKPIRTI